MRKKMQKVLNINKILADNIENNKLKIKMTPEKKPFIDHLQYK